MIFASVRLVSAERCHEGIKLQTVENSLPCSMYGKLLWQRVRESNPCTSLERAVS
jgi:hypothetical protein